MYSPAAALLFLLVFAAYAGGAALSFLTGLWSAARARRHRGEYALALAFLAILLLEPLVTLTSMILNYPLDWPPNTDTSFRTPIETALVMTAPMVLLLLPVSGLTFRTPRYRFNSIAILVLGATRWALLMVTIRYLLLPGVAENPAYVLTVAAAVVIWLTPIYGLWQLTRPLSPGRQPKEAGDSVPKFRIALGIVASIAALGLVKLLGTPSRLAIEAVELHSLTLGENSLADLAWSPDGGLVAAIGSPGVHVWRASDGALVSSLVEHQFGAQALAWSPDGDRIAIGLGREISLWRAEDGALLGTLPNERFSDWEWNAAVSLAFSPDGGMLAAGMSDRTIRRWRVEDREALPVLAGHPAEVSSVAFSPDGGRLASASKDGTIALWSALTGDLQQTMDMGEAVNLIQFSPDSRLLAAAAQGPADHAEFETRASLALWSVADGSRVQHWETNDFRVSSMVFLPDGQRLVATMDYTPWAGYVRIYDLDSGGRYQVPMEEFCFNRAAFSPDVSMIAATWGCNGYGGLMIWRLED